MNQQNIRNIAIIAHVDHGKTTLVDAFLKQSHLFRENQEEMNQEMILDSGELEREKGITIKAKNIAIRYTPAGEAETYKINIIDTPGHADFGGEVERTLNMADGCILLVDAQEGPMPQTKFVLKKALELGLKPMVVINKIDKKYANPARVLNRLHDLFLQLATDVEQLEFPVFYAIGRQGKAYAELPKALNDDIENPIYPESDMKVLLDAIVKYVPAPTGDSTQPLQMQITTLEFDAHQGRFLVGKVSRGTIKKDSNIVVVSRDDEGKVVEIARGKIKNLRVREGLGYEEVTSASAGEIVGIAGLETTAIGATVCDPGSPEPLSAIKISNPSVQIKFEANTSPFMGKEGKFVTAKLLQARLEKEIETNISLKITKGDGGSYYVAGRGELQLSILIETMRREGYEFQIRKPEVIFQVIDGVKSEPIEELVIDVPEEYQGTVLQNMESESGQVKFTYKILTRNLLGLRNVLMTSTKGNAVVNNFLLGYVPFTEQPEIFRKGVLVSSETGVAMGYSLNTVQERGDLIVEPGTKVYEGMIIGIHKYENDLDVNPVKERQKSAVRMKHDEITQTSLKAIKPVTLEFALLFLAGDEILEVTPQNLRLRKQYLTKTERDWSKRKNLTDYAKAQMGIS
jgi:GTP-binding protein